MSDALVLDLLRHAEAEPSNALGDRGRGLTALGRSDLKRLAAELAASARHDRAFASPLRRARESARLALGGRRARIESLEALLPDREPDELLDALDSLGVDRGRVLLVGHQPLLGRLSARLTGRELRFSPATLVRVRCEAGARSKVAHVEWTWHAEEHRAKS